MLQGIRDRAQGWIAWVVVGLISIPFALWGIHEYLGGGADVVVATVNGQELNQPQLQHAYAQEKANLRALLGGDLDDELFAGGQLKTAALERLIEHELLSQAAYRNGLRISDAQLAQSIRQQAIFREGGIFSESQYARWLRAQGYSASAFEHDLRRSLSIEQLSSGITQSVVLPERDLESVLRLLEQQRRFSGLRIVASNYEQEVNVSESDIESYYQQHLGEYREPERVRIEFIELSRQGLAETVTASEEQLQQLYQTERQRYVVAEQRRASHILLSAPAQADESTVAAARKRAEQLYQRIEQGEDFEAFVREASDDPGSRKADGDLGFFGRGVMDKAFEDVVFSMKVGEISAPVQSSYGFHLIRLTEVRPEKVKPFQEVRTELLRYHQQQQAEMLFFEYTERLADLAFEHPNELQTAAEALGLSVEVSEPFDRSEDGDRGMTSHPKVLDAAFSPEVLQDGSNSDLIDLDGERVVVLRVKEHLPAAQRPLSEVRDEIAQAIRSDRARARAIAVGRELLDRLRAGAEPTDVAESLGLEWSAPRTIGRGDSSVEAGIRDTLFRMPHPVGDTAQYDGALSISGDLVVISLESVKDGDPTVVEEERKRDLKEGLRRDYAHHDFDALVQGLRTQAKIQVYGDRI
ncbi:MAG: SurA N-terminal domain-containing protein [Gammaproteobacteria bacterium]